jgi:hypothetical protein
VSVHARVAKFLFRTVSITPSLSVLKPNRKPLWRAQKLRWKLFLWGG